MIEQDRLEFWANSTAKSDDSHTSEKIEMAKELIALRRIAYAMYTDELMESDDCHFMESLALKIEATKRGRS